MSNHQARLLLAKLHVSQTENLPDIDYLRAQFELNYNQLSKEEQIELNILSGLLNGPTEWCPGSCIPIARGVEGICPECKQMLPIFQGRFAKHSRNLEHEPGFLNRVLKDEGLKAVAL